MESLTSVARRLRTEGSLAVVVTRDWSCDEAAPETNGLRLERVQAPSPTTYAAGLATLLLGVEPREHGVMGDEIFAPPVPLSARDGRPARKERRFYRHYARYGWAYLLAAHWQRFRLRRSVVGACSARSAGAVRVLWRDDEYPFLRRLLGLHERGERVASLADAFARVEQASSRRAGVASAPWLILGHSFGLTNAQLLGAFADWCRRPQGRLRKLLVSTNGRTDVDYALMFTQGEIVSLMRRGVFLCLSGRWCGIYGERARSPEVEALFAEKFAAAARYTPVPRCDTAGRTGRLPLPFAVATAQGTAVFAYEEIPAPFAAGGDSDAERVLPMVSTTAPPESRAGVGQNTV
jgi:hypothetical protein